MLNIGTVGESVMVTVIHVLLGTLIGALCVGLVSGHTLWIILMESLDMGRPAHCILTSFPGLGFWTVYNRT